MKGIIFKHGKLTVSVTWDAPSDDALRQAARLLVEKIEGVGETTKAGE